MKPKDIKKINTIGEGGCPCGEYDDGETIIHAHCWKTNSYWVGGKNRCKCPYSGLHYSGNLKTVKEIAKEIKEGYSCEVKIVKL